MRVRSRAFAATLIAVLVGDAAASAQAPRGPGTGTGTGPGTKASAPPVDADARRKEEAKLHFEKGLRLFDMEAWDGALTEFRLSREIFPTRSATKNAAIALRKLNRFDEALDMFDELLRIPNLAAEDKALAEREVKALADLVGLVDVQCDVAGAAVRIDGRDRGVTPTPGAAPAPAPATSGTPSTPIAPGATDAPVVITKPLRVSGGTHTVRITKDGFTPFEQRVDVAGGRTTRLGVKLAPLEKAGRLRVSEQQGRVLEVVVDGTVVGKTPWEGSLPPGNHTVFLRGEGKLGTPPALAPVIVDEVTPLTLAAEELSATLRVEPTPAGASVDVDGVTVGRGLWEGALRPGAHRLEVIADGFATERREITLVAGKRELVTVQLERAVTGGAAPRSWRIYAEIDADFGIAPTLGGELASSCTGHCSAPLGIGFAALGRAGVRFKNGAVVGLDGGYLLVSQPMAQRATTLKPTGLPANSGTVSDALTLRGGLIGASAGYQLGARVPLIFRLGAGAFLGALHDRRTGNFTTVARTGKPAAAYAVDVIESPAATSVYLAPEVRVGMHIGPRFEVSFGAEAMVLIALQQPTWAPNEKHVRAATDGQGTFAAQTLSSSVMVLILPGIGAKYEF